MGDPQRHTDMVVLHMTFSRSTETKLMISPVENSLLDFDERRNACNRNKKKL